MKNVHDQILEYLHKNHTASAAELSRVLQLTRADVRYHLNQLQDSKEIEKATLRRTAHRGRPTQSFRIASAARQENFSKLADGILSVLNISATGSEIIAKLADYFATQIPIHKLPAQQLNQLIVFLTERGHAARWEAYTNGPRILFRNCPYAQILPQHPELCTLDTRIISTYLGQPFEQTARIDTDYAKIPACIFTLKNQAR
jgi:predicted ArsR family transcriptional regulator